MRLAFDKAKRGSSIDWIGCTISIVSRDVVHATIMKERVDEVKELTRSILDQNVIAVKPLRSYIGKVQSFASLLHTWRPFIAMLWAVLFQDVPSNAPPNCRWTNQLVEPLRWISAFLNREAGNIVRIYTVSAFYNVGRKSSYMLMRLRLAWAAGSWLTISQSNILRTRIRNWI